MGEAPRTDLFYAASEGDFGGSGASAYTLTFDTNVGKIAGAPKSGGAVVDLTGYVSVRDGYTFDGWYSDAKPTDKGSENRFADVSDDAYYANAVLWVAGNGITGGTTATTFSTNSDYASAQSVTFLFH